MARFAAELDALPAAVVGEFSACPPPGCAVDRTAFFAQQLKVRGGALEVSVVGWP